MRLRILCAISNSEMECDLVGFFIPSLHSLFCSTLSTCPLYTSCLPHLWAPHPPLSLHLASISLHTSGFSSLSLSLILPGSPSMSQFPPLLVPGSVLPISESLSNLSSLPLHSFPSCPTGSQPQSPCLTCGSLPLWLLIQF